MLSYKSIFTVCAGLVVLWPLSSFSEPLAGGPRTVNMQRILSESIAGKAARNSLEDEARKRKAALQRMKVEVDALREEIGSQGALLAEAALEEKRDSLKKKEIELSRSLQDSQRELSIMSNREIDEVVQETYRVVEKLATAEGYAFILEDDPKVVLYAREGFDITDEVIEALNKRKLDL